MTKKKKNDFRYARHALPLLLKISQTNAFVAGVIRVMVHYADLRIVAGRVTGSSPETHMAVCEADSISSRLCYPFRDEG